MNKQTNRQTQFYELLLHESCLDLSEYFFAPIRTANQMLSWQVQPNNSNLAHVYTA